MPARSSASALGARLVGHGVAARARGHRPGASTPSWATTPPTSSRDCPGVDGSVALAGPWRAPVPPVPPGSGLALPGPGDPVGSAGRRPSTPPPSRPARRSSPGAVGLVPPRVGAAVEWTAYAASPRQLDDVGEADRGLRRALRRRHEAGRPRRGALATRGRRRADEPAPPPRLRPPPGTPERLRRISPAARSRPGDRRPRPRGRRRRGQRRRGRAPGRAAALGAAAARGLVAACSPEVWPPA